MTREVARIIDSYNPDLPLNEAESLPSAWYTDPRIYELERQRVFHSTWQVVGREEQVRMPGSYLTADLAGEPVLVVRGKDAQLRAFYNVCRHHAAAVCVDSCGEATHFRCPYHGWTYGLDGSLKGAPEFSDVHGFSKTDHGLVPIRVEAWEKFVLVCLDETAPDLNSFLGGLVPRIANLKLGPFEFVERRTYELACNWKVFVDNYLDGGYHVPHIHGGLSSVLDYAEYRIECFDRFCLQSSPLADSSADSTVARVRQGDMAFYYWQYPNFMLNWYEGYLDSNLALPLGVDRMLAVFDFFFADPGALSGNHAKKSLDVAEVVQQEDIQVCESVQRGLSSRAYDAGRLSVRREAGEHLFHRLLYHDLADKKKKGPAP